MPSYYRDSTAPEPNQPRDIGVTALVERDGSVLVERRADSEVVEWAFVGGALGEESVVNALRQELREETMSEIQCATPFGIFSDPTRIVAYPDGNVPRLTSIVFPVRPEGGAEPVPGHESAEMRFVSRRALGELPFWPAHVPIRDAFLGAVATPVVA